MNSDRVVKFYKIIFWALILLFAVLTTYEVTALYGGSGRLKLLYSLDRKRNDKELVNLIDGAHQYVYFAVYTFTKENIADALVRAKQRGVEVRGITDAKEADTQYEKKVLDKLAAAGIKVETQKHPDGIMHIKAVVTEGVYAFGSYNWTSAATFLNDEILAIGDDRSGHDQIFDILKRVLAANQ